MLLRGARATGSSTKSLASDSACDTSWQTELYHSTVHPRADPYCCRIRHSGSRIHGRCDGPPAYRNTAAHLYRPNPRSASVFSWDGSSQH
eukprot:498104-Pyramimonas_sp.AAC.2